jgi:hypothetical protein
MPSFFAPDSLSGTAELTVTNGLTVVEQGLWNFSQAGYNDQATFGLSLTHPKPDDGGALRVEATNWSIAVIGNQLTDYVGEDSVFYPASRCRIVITGNWQIVRQQNSNSFNSTGIDYGGHTHTDLGNRDYWGTFFTNRATYVIQGADVDGGAQDTFTSHRFYAHMTETTSTDNSNRLYQSNTITRPVWVYTYSKSWQISP